MFRKLRRKEYAGYQPDRRRPKRSELDELFRRDFKEMGLIRRRPAARTACPTP